MHSAFVPSMTPFTESDALNEDALRVHLRRLGAAGMGVYLGGSGSSEGYALSLDERRRVLEIGVEELKGVVPVRAMGVEPRTAKEMIAFAQMVATTGIDAVQLYPIDPGHGIMLRLNEHEAFYEAVLNEISMPVVLSMHHHAGYILPLDLVEKLLDRHPQIIGINYTFSDLGARGGVSLPGTRYVQGADSKYFVQLADLLRGRAELHAGSPSQILSVLALGGTGFLTSEGNIAPRMCMEIIHQWEKGDLSGVADAFLRFSRFQTQMAQFTLITGVKTALQVLGFPAGPAREPRQPLADDDRDHIARVLAEFNIAETEGF